MSLPRILYTKTCHPFSTAPHSSNFNGCQVLIIWFVMKSWKCCCSAQNIFYKIFIFFEKRVWDWNAHFECGLTKELIKTPKHSVEVNVKTSDHFICFIYFCNSMAWKVQFMINFNSNYKSFSSVMNSNTLRFWSFKSSMVYDFVISFPKCKTLHSDVLNFNSHFLDHLMNRLISFWSLLSEVVEFSFCINFVSSAYKNVMQICLLGYH